MEAVLEYWFGPLASDESFPDQQAKKWFGGGEAVNEEIRTQFGRDQTLACEGHYDDWQENPRGCLALVILLDQFTRNLYGDARAYAMDDKALLVVLRGIERGLDKKLKIIERWFFYMPFMHSEDLEIQEKGIELFTKLAEEAPPALELPIRNALGYAIRHMEIIKRFGRFPHRNEALGRESTPQEVEFLKEPNSSF